MKIARRWIASSAGLLSAAALVSCASISVQPGSEHATPRMPELIYVMPFDTTKGVFNVDREDEELSDFKKDLEITMQTAMVDDLTDRLSPAVAGRNRENPKIKNAWLVEGEFTLVNQGSRLLRGVVGFGAGGTKVETKVRVYDVATDRYTPFLTFSTTGGSNAEPGAILTYTTDPFYIAVGGLGNLSHGLTEDTARTAREITAELSDYMYRHHWISKAVWIAPKVYKK